MEASPAVPRPSSLGAPFVSRPNPNAWGMPAMYASVAATTIVFLAGQSDPLTLATAVLVPVAAAFVAAFLAKVDVEGGQMCVTTLGIRRRCIFIFGLRSVTTRTVRWHPAPALVLVALDGTRLAIRLGSWRREDELVAMIATAADRAHADIDAEAADILARRPTADMWLPGAPRGSISGGEQLTWGRLLRQGIVLGIGLLLIFGLSRVAGPAASFVSEIWETALFPKHPDPAWVDRFEIPTGPAVSWGGNVVDTGGHIALATEEDFEGSRAIAKVRTSDDGGRTWSPPVSVSGRRNVLGQTLVSAPDGTLTIAWSQADLLLVRRSRDGGRSWSEQAAVAPASDSGGWAILPAVVTTETVLLMAYTDGFGDIWAQPLTPEGAPDGDPARVSVHRSASTLPVGDGLLGLAATGSRIALAYVRGENEVAVALSDDGGRHWRQISVGQWVYGGHPRLASDGSTLVLAVAEPGVPKRDRRGNFHDTRPLVRIQVSRDGGATWQQAPKFEAAASTGPLELAWTGGMWRLLYLACPSVDWCVTDGRIWYTTSRDGQDWTEPIVVTDVGPVTPVGIVADESGVSAVWATLESEHDWRLSVSRRNE